MHCGHRWVVGAKDPLKVWSQVLVCWSTTQKLVSQKNRVSRPLNRFLMEQDINSISIKNPKIGNEAFDCLHMRYAVVRFTVCLIMYNNFNKLRHRQTTP